MQVTVGNQLRIENPSEQLLTWCKKQLILPNPEYAKKVRMHFWVGNTPEKLYLFQWDGDTLVLPYGCLNDVLAMDDCHMKVNLPTPTEVDFGCTIPLYDYQVEAKEALITAYYGILQAPAGCGKTQIGIAVAADTGRRTLWLTHTRDLLVQSKSRAEQYMSPSLTGTITEGRVQIGKAITFATVQTMCNLDLNQYIKNHPYNMAAARTSMIMAATPDTFGFDCVNLIKAVLWGWTGDKTKSYGGAKYATNGVPDEGADTMIKRCKDATSSGWDKVDPGEVVWTTGHIGVYIGNGLAVECSPRWANNVQITAVGNIGKKNGYNTRMWKKHGHLPYVTYDKTVTPAQPETVKPVPTTEVKAKGVARSFNKAVAGTYTVTAGAGLNVRDAAGTESRVLVTIPKGTTVKNYGYYTVVNGVKWLYVAFSYKRVNYTGFVHERFLSR